MKKSVLLFLTLVLVFCTFGEAMNIAAADRKFDYDGPSFWTHSIDKTLFFVNETIRLRQLDLLRVYLYNSRENITVDSVPAEIRIYRIDDKEDHKELIVKPSITLSSNSETRASIYNGVFIYPNLLYLIQVETTNHAVILL